MPLPVRALLLLALTLAGMLATGGTSATSPDRSAEGPNWVPLTGSIRLGRTWGHRGGHAFPAIDFTIPAGKSVPVYAAGPGTVLAAEGRCQDTTADGANADCNGGQGNFVEIAHPDGRRSRYLHLHHGTVTVQPGEHVCRGCPIGRTGWSGNVSPPGPRGGHLHYEELRGFGTVDPGPMHALHRAGRVTYPSGGRGWKEIGGDRLLIRNVGYPPPGPAPTASCAGWAATRVGTSETDHLVGTSGPDIIAAGAGNDSVRGVDGDDRICGGPGDDTLVGGAQQDLIDGGEGTDTCFGDEQDGYQASGSETLISCERPPYVLTVEVGCCARVVTSDPAGISCPPDCSEPYGPGTVVRLTLSTPEPQGGRWVGCDEESMGSTCTVTMTADRIVRV